MKAWMTEHKAVTGSLHVGRFADPMYFLLRPITWKPNPDQADTYQAVTAPTGFVTDFASVPRAFWSLLRPDGLYTYPAILHDYLYWTQEKPKSFADNVLKFGMEDFGVSKSIVTAIYQAVSLFGQSAWDENTRRKAAGEQRILQKFPDDPRITWSAWKERTDAFR